MSANDTKHTEQIKVNLTERELLDVTRLATLEDRTNAEFIRRLIRSYLYGNVIRLSTTSEVTSKD